MDQGAYTTRRGRFRFGLKSLLVVMTIVCVYLGWRTARHLQATAIVARSNAVLNVIESNMAAAPPNTSFVTPLHLRQRSATFQKRARPDQADQTDRLGQVFGGGSLYSMATRSEPLDIMQLLTTGNAAAASVQIRSHYERGLAKLGLRRAMTGDGEKSTAIWQMPEHGLYVIIDVDADPVRKQADVRAIFLHSESLSAW